MIKISKGLVHKVPSELNKRLHAFPLMLKNWEDITPIARNEWICWIESAKKSETRKHRLDRTQIELIKGKRRPCCWAGCGHR